MFERTKTNHQKIYPHTQCSLLGNDYIVVAIFIRSAKDELTFFFRGEGPSRNSNGESVSEEVHLQKV
jgi:hypothetical protein